jgi:mono/diheme cytochrome c family protein
MRNFILGVVVTVLVAALGGLALALLGFMPTRADATPPKLETRVAMSAVDAAMERHAAKINNPIPATESNLIDGMKIYTMNCALCHGALDKKPSPLAASFYPPPPQLIIEPLDDPEWHVYYAVRTGIRYTGMPAWSKALSDEDIWKVTGFLTRLEKLPTGVKDYWQKAFGVSPDAPGETHEHEGEHH